MTVLQITEEEARRLEPDNTSARTGVEYYERRSVPVSIPDSTKLTENGKEYVVCKQRCTRHPFSLSVCLSVSLSPLPPSLPPSFPLPPPSLPPSPFFLFISSLCHSLALLPLLLFVSVFPTHFLSPLPHCPFLFLLPMYVSYALCLVLFSYESP